MVGFPKDTNKAGSEHAEAKGINYGIVNNTQAAAWIPFFSFFFFFSATAGIALPRESMRRWHS
ncbi:hypothetical protein LZ32DRAFT_606225 [Colletotrichum eremochloae]|nr:hypothetical protein LZ32DRAFT_606225 [Colletotrichum eremochloae]